MLNILEKESCQASMGISMNLTVWVSASQVTKSLLWIVIKPHETSFENMSCMS